MTKANATVAPAVQRWTFGAAHRRLQKASPAGRDGLGDLQHALLSSGVHRVRGSRLRNRFETTKKLTHFGLVSYRFHLFSPMAIDLDTGLVHRGHVDIALALAHARQHALLAKDHGPGRGGVGGAGEDEVAALHELLAAVGHLAWPFQVAI